jgi:hypothetical protein
MMRVKTRMRMIRMLRRTNMIRMRLRIRTKLRMIRMKMRTRM